MAWNPEVFTEGEWVGNGLFFATKEEAEQWGRDLLARWYVPTDSRAVEVDRPVNYVLVEGVLTPVAEPTPVAAT